MTNSRDIARAVVTLLDEGVALREVAAGVDAFLMRMHLSHFGVHIARHLERIYASREAYNTAEVSLGRTHTRTLGNRIIEDVAPESVTHTISVNEDLIGGFRAAYQHQVTDASVRGYIDQLRTHLHT